MQASSVLSSQYSKQPSPIDVIPSILIWKDSPTVAGFLISAAEDNIPIGITERLEVLHLLAFASPDFSMKIASALSGAEGEEVEMARWLRSFSAGVEYKLEFGLSEEEILTEDESRGLDQHFKREVEESGQAKKELLRSPLKPLVQQGESYVAGESGSVLDTDQRINPESAKGGEIANEEVHFWD